MKPNLTVICGSMFAGKSTELLRQAERHTLARREVVFVKPSIDNRYSASEIVTHSGKKVPCFTGSLNADFIALEAVKNAAVICIDEVQFYDKSIVNAVNELLQQGKIVICAGLNLDRFGVPFGYVPQLLAMAEFVYKLTAVCEICGADSYITMGKDSLRNTDTVNVGNEYTPVCRSCYNKRG